MTMDISRSLQNIQPSYIREILSAAKSPGVISLAGGLPATDLIPLHLFAAAMKTLTDTPDLFQYGETRGYEPLLHYIEKEYCIPSTMGSIICNGSQQGLDLIARAFLNPSDKVVVEAPSYLGALQVFGLAQADIISISQTSTGPDLNALESLFSSQKIALFYAVPDFHNPTGICWSLTVRQHVASLCQRYGVILIEDVPYRDLRFIGKPLPLVSTFCEGQSIILRSFSKMSAPGIRLGVLSAPLQYLSSMIKVKQASDLHTGLPMQAALMHVLNDSGFPQHIDNIRSTYKTRYYQLKELLLALREQACSFDDIEGGMFIWLRLPAIDPMALANDLLKNGVAVVPSNVFYRTKDAVQPALRLNFTHCALAKLETAVSTLIHILKSRLG